METLLERHLKCWGGDREWLRNRVFKSDRKNALLVHENRVNADKVVQFQHREISVQAE